MDVYSRRNTFLRNFFHEDVTLALIIIISQYYCYRIVSFLIPELSNDIFTGENSIRLQKSFQIIAISSLLKPIFSYIFGKISDTTGLRKSTLISLLGVSFFCFILCILPSASYIGVKYASLILLIAQMGISGLVPCAVDGARVFIFESTQKKARGFIDGVSNSLHLIGGAIASFVVYIVSISKIHYAWRIACFIGFATNIILIVSCYNLSSLNNLHGRTLNKKYDQYKSKSVISLFAENKILSICCICLLGTIGSVFQFCNVFIGNYLSLILNLIDLPTLRFVQVIGILLYVVFALISGVIINRYGIRQAFIHSTIVVTISILCLFISLIRCQFSYVSFILIQISGGLITPVCSFIIKSSIPKIIRHRLFGISHACGSILFSIPTSWYCIKLYNIAQVSYIPVVYLVFIALLFCIASFVLIENFFEKESNEN